MLPLHSNRLLLRRFLEWDLPHFLEYRNDSEVSRYQGWETLSALDATEFIQQQMSLEPGLPGKWLQIAIQSKTSGLLLGDCAFKIHIGEPRQATIGITLARPHQRQGFAAEALTILCDYLFDNMLLHRVVADTDPLNKPAWALLERLGMRREGHLIQSLWFKGQWTDEYLYAVTREEWLLKT